MRKTPVYFPYNSIVLPHMKDVMGPLVRKKEFCVIFLVICEVT